MSTAFQKENFRAVRHVHPTESRFLGEDSEAEIIGLDRRRSAYPHGAELRSLAQRARDERLEEFRLAQLAKDSKWWRVALRRAGFRL